MVKVIKNLLALTLCLVLVGCAHEPQSVYISPSERQQTVSQLTTWRAQGSLSLTANDQHDMVSFNWLQVANNLFSVRFSTFTYSVVLQNNHGQLTLSKPIKGIDSSLFQSLLDAQYWLRGLPLPRHLSRGSVSKAYDQYGRLLMLQQSSWLIHYQKYALYSGYELPTQVTISDQQLQLKLVISRWDVTPSRVHVVAPSADVALLKSI